MLHGLPHWLNSQDAAWWSAAGTWLTAVVAAAAALFAAGQVREARRVREAQSQPFVVVSIEQSDINSSYVVLRVENIGQTLARDVSMTFNPPLQSFHDDKNGVGLTKGSLFVSGVPSMPPRMRIERVFDDTRLWGDDRVEQTVWGYEVTVRCKDYRGRQQEPLIYRIDLHHLLTGTFLDRRGIHHAATALEGVHDQLKKLNQSR